MSSPAAHAAADLASLLPPDAPLAQLGRRVLNDLAAEEATMSDTEAEKRARQLDEYDHTHDPNGHFIQLSAPQDAAGASCEHCGLTLTFSDARTAIAWAHAIACPHYTPHPASIAATGGN